MTLWGLLENWQNCRTANRSSKKISWTGLTCKSASSDLTQANPGDSKILVVSVDNGFWRLQPEDISYCWVFILTWSLPNLSNSMGAEVSRCTVVTQVLILSLPPPSLIFSALPYSLSHSLSLSLSLSLSHTHTHTNTSSTLIHAVMQALETQRGQTKSFTFSTSKRFSFFIVVLVRRFCVNLNSGHFYFMDFWCNGKCLPQKWQVVDSSQESTSPKKN